MTDRLLTSNLETSLLRGTEVRELRAEVERLQRLTARMLPYIQEFEPGDAFEIEAQTNLVAEAQKALAGLPVETSRELERLRELQEKALALDDAVAEFGIDKPQYIAEVYQAFHDVLHDGHGSPSVVKTLVEVRAFGTSIDPPSQKASGESPECRHENAIPTDIAAATVRDDGSPGTGIPLLRCQGCGKLVMDQPESET